MRPGREERGFSVHPFPLAAFAYESPWFFDLIPGTTGETVRNGNERRSLWHSVPANLAMPAREVEVHRRFVTASKVIDG